MKVFLAALIAVAAPAVQATLNLNFGLTCNGARNQMSTLAAKIAEIKVVAQGQGHVDIINKCDEAHSHVSQASSSFSVISATFSAKPWLARDSSHSTDVRYRLGLCGNILNWIFAQPQVQSCQDYNLPVNQCQNAYVGCQQSFGNIWNWPSPPTPYFPPQPQPSQAYGRHHHHHGFYGRSVTPTPKDCPAFEDACPISSGLGGEECVDVHNDVSSCGGCVSKKEGENCLLIDGANGVGCLEGICVVLSVLDGYSLDKNGRPVRGSS